MGYLHIEQSDDADRVVCNDARVLISTRWWSLQRRRIAVYRQLDDSAARPGAIGAGPSTLSTSTFDFVALFRIYRAVVAFGQSALPSSPSRHSAPLQAYYLCEGGLHVVVPIVPSYLQTPT